MAASAENLYVVDGSFDWSGGVDSSRVTTLQSTLNPNGLPRNMLAWLNNATVRNGGILQRTGWQPKAKILDQPFYWQGGYLYEPDGANPYIVAQISGVTYQILCEPPYTVTDLTGGNPLLLNPSNPAVAEMAFFTQGENFLVQQAGDYFNPGPIIPGVTDTNGRTLPLFWNGISLRRSIGITTPSAPAQAPGINEIPAATCMDYFGNRLWYAQGRQYSAGDIAGGPAGTAPYHFRDAILNVTENPLSFGGDGFSVPVSAGIIRSLKHSANINESLGEGQFYIFTRKAVFSLIVPQTRIDWINADTNNIPKQITVQLVNGAVGDRCVVPYNGDLYYQSFDPAIRSLIRAVQYFQQSGNTAISQNEQRALDQNDRGLMRFSSGVEFNQRVLQCVLPKLALDGQNIVHQAILPLDFDTVTNFEERHSPVWEGAYDGLNIVQLFSGDFGGLQRAFAVAISDVDGSLNLWELTLDSKTQNGDNRVVWSPEFPAFTWSSAGYEHDLKQLVGGECWIDKVSGTVEMDVYYKVDAEPCWRRWFHRELCSKRCEDNESWDSAYPCDPYREGYVFPVVLPEPQTGLCGDMQVRPPTLGYQFQVKIMFRGWCRVRGLLLHAVPRSKQQYEGLVCQATVPVGMASLPPALAPISISNPTPLPVCTVGDLVESGGSPQVGTAYSATVSATGGSGHFGFSISSGTLPTGLALSGAGVISGTPSAAGTFTFTVRATDSEFFITCDKQFSLTVTVIPGNLPTHVTGFLICDWASIRAGLVDNTCGASSKPAWNGVFDYTINLSTGEPVYLFLSQSISPGAGSAQAYAADEKPNYPVGNWPDDVDYCMIVWNTFLSQWILNIQCVGGANDWFGLGPATPGNPVGAYTALSGAPATINIVPADQPGLCP